VNTMQPVWIDIGKLDDIPVRGARVVKTAKGCVAVFRTAENGVYAVDDRCPHKGGPLSQGIVHGHSVTCPLHSWVIDLTTGMAQGTDVGSVKTVPLKTKAGRLLLEANALWLGRGE
jgi:nitrite reductase (NADH) small subunit